MSLSAAAMAAIGGTLGASKSLVQKKQYGMSARDYLLEHDGGKHLDVLTRIEVQAEALLEAGMDYMALQEAQTRDVLKIQENLGL
ncbi:hypothetical protein D3C87_1055340 [compost metagenome]|uniref:hypothetical protein n=1 Tax=Aeromonas rivipollensis TaxID=948519 RepID=UPI000F9DF982